MGIPNRMIIENLRKKFPVGTRVALMRMNDRQAPPLGTKGTVTGVDDIGSIMVDWDNGSGLNVVYGEDLCRKIDTVKTICYNKEQVWDSREEAMKFFLDAMIGSDGSEKERYANIFAKLKLGMEVCDGD